MWNRRTLLAAPMLALAGPARAQGPQVVVATGLLATYCIASTLAVATGIKVIPAFPPDLGMAQQASWLTHRARPEFAATAQRVQAAIGLHVVWPADPLYPEIRRHNIRAVEIDASASFQPELAGVATLRLPDGQGHSAVSPYVWLSLTNVVRMTDIVAADLMRLAEADATEIARNRDQFRAKVLALRAEYERHFAALDDPAAVLFTPELAYLLSDLSVRIAGHLPNSGLTSDTIGKALSHVDASAFVATSMPPPDIAEWITSRGGRIALLDTLDPGPVPRDGVPDQEALLHGLRNNLAALLTALQA